MLKKLFSLVLVLAISLEGWGQEFNCKISIMHDKITNVDPQMFVTMQKAFNDFFNSQKWTTDEYKPAEKIDVNILFNLTSNNLNGDVDAYAGTMNIQATRPVYNSGYTSTIVNYIDKDIAFHFGQGNTLHFDDNQVSGTDPLAANATAIMAYYAYLILALDYDSFSPEGGTVYLKKAQNVTNSAPDGKGISGWKSAENQRNRFWITDQLLNTRFSEVRGFWYTMHREGLDSMYMKPNEARTRILTSLKKLYNVNRENPSSILLQFVFNAKSDEILHILAQAPKPDRGQYITLLSAMDVPNSGKYNAYR